MSTPFVDSLDHQDEQYLYGELERLRASEAEQIRRVQASRAAFEQETRSIIGLTKERLGEHDTNEKALNGFQNKLKQSQTIVLDLERTLRKLQREADQARRCVTLLDAYNSFAQSPTKLHEILGDDDDGVLSSQLQAFAESVRNPDEQVTCQALSTWIQARVDERLSRFDASRRSNHVENLQKHASYVVRHRRGLDLLCAFVARLALRPLSAASRSKPTKEDIPLLFDQLAHSISDGQTTIVTSLGEELHAQATAKYVDRIIHLMFSDNAGLKATLSTWFPPLDAPVPGIALERVEMLIVAKTQFDQRILVEQLAQHADLIDLRSRMSRLFDTVSSDYYSLEISLLESNFKLNAPTIPNPSDPSINTIDLERLMMGKCKDFIKKFVKQAEHSYARASAFLGENEDALEICLETLVSCTCSRVIDEIVLPCCRASAQVCQDPSIVVDSSKSESFSTSQTSVQAMRRSSSLRSFPSNGSLNGASGAKEPQLPLNQRCRFISEALTPFLEDAVITLEAAHAFSEAGSAIQNLVQTKIELAEGALETLYAHQVDSALSEVWRALQGFSAKETEQDLDKVEEDAILARLIERICTCSQSAALLGEGVLTNFALSSKDILFARIGAIKKVSEAGGQVLAKDLNKAAGDLEEAFRTVTSPENRGIINRVTAELRQTAHAFVLPKDEVVRGSVVMDLITKELAQELLQKRSY